MKEDAVLFAAARDGRMPRRDQVHLVAARGDAFRDGLHEAADAVARKSRVRRRDHHDDLPHRVSQARWTHAAAAEDEPPRRQQRLEQHRSRDLR